MENLKEKIKQNEKNFISMTLKAKCASTYGLMQFSLKMLACIL